VDHGGYNLDRGRRGLRREGLVASLLDLVLRYRENDQNRADATRLTLKIIIVIANMHSTMVAHLETTVDALGHPLKHLH
jgi:hypothetical protein